MRDFLGSLSIRTIVTTALVSFMLLLALVTGLGYVGTELGGRALESRTQTGTRIGLLSQTEVLRQRAFARLGIYNRMSIEERLLGSAEKQKQQTEIADLLKQAREHLAAYRSLPPFVLQDGRQLFEALVAGLDTSLDTLDRQRQAWLDGDIQAYANLEAEMLSGRVQVWKNLQESMAYLEALGERQLDDYRSSLRNLAIIGGLSLVVALLLLALRALLLGFVVRPVSEAVGHVQRLAKADLSQPIPVTSRNEIGQLLMALRDMQESLARIVGNVRAGSGAILVGTQQIAGGNADLSSRTEQQAASLEETAASMEELTATVKQNADNARQASALANDASSMAGQGREVVGRVVETVFRLGAELRRPERLVVPEKPFQAKLKREHARNMANVLKEEWAAF